MGEEEELREKGIKALKMLLFEGSTPGLKGWELKRRLGKDYLAALEVAKVEADKLGLRIVKVEDEEDKSPEKARYVLQPKEPLREAELSKWLRIEEAAALAIIDVELNLRGGMVQRKTIERILTQKLPSWRVKQILDKLKRLNYIEEDGDILRKGWRMIVEIDEPGLLKDIISKAKET